MTSQVAMPQFSTAEFSLSCHPPIAPVLSAADHAAEPAWSVDDVKGHGTQLAGLAPDHIWTSAPETAPQVPSKSGGALERSLFLPVYASDLNDDEKQVAVYLDAEAVIKWWHRNGTDRGSYALRGWRRGNVYPDFVFAALKDDAGERLIAIESKGDQLAGNLDTEYKRELLETLTKAYGKNAGTNAGELPLAAKTVEYEAAVVLFSDMNAKLPVLISGGA